MMTDTLMTSPAPTPQEIAELQASAIQASRLMKLLASEQRLVLLCALLEKECSVGELARGAGLSQTTASQHLAKLRAERIVATRRDDPDAVTILHTLCDVYKPKGAVRKN